jgi:hypothetical protein
MVLLGDMCQVEAYFSPFGDKLPLDTCHLRVPSGLLKMICMPEVHSAQTVHLSYAEINTISKQTKMSFHHHLGVPSGVPKMISMLMVHSAQTV